LLKENKEMIYNLTDKLNKAKLLIENTKQLLIDSGNKVNDIKNKVEKLISD